MNEDNSLMKSKATRTGYGNPPASGRFKKGQSGNPRGRPKGTLNMASLLERTLRAKTVIQENGKSVTVTMFEAAIRQLTNKAASGELKALQLLAVLVRSAEERAAQAPAASTTLSEADEKVVLGILKRLETINTEGQKDDSDPQ